VPIGELGGGEQADEKSGFVSLIWRSKWSMNQSQRRAGERVGMLWSGAADHTTHRKSLPCSLLRHVTFLPLVKTYIARYASQLYLRRATLSNNCLSLIYISHFNQDRMQLCIPFRQKHKKIKSDKEVFIKGLNFGGAKFI
jgi:hypothetical protein